MTTTYRLELNDGHVVEQRAASAAEALDEVIWKCRGFVVVKIHSGLTKLEASQENARRRADGKPETAMVGLIWYDIPPHNSIGPDAVRKEIVPKSAFLDSTTPMFSDASISEESEKAQRAAIGGFAKGDLVTVAGYESFGSAKISRTFKDGTMALRFKRDGGKMNVHFSKLTASPAE